MLRCLVMFLCAYLFIPLAEAQYRPPVSYQRPYQLVPPRPVPAGRPVYPLRNPMPVYNPYFTLDGEPLYEPYDEPCHYDETYGQWVGPCQTSLDTPGFSITVPNRVR